jgi:predicted DNA-binding transcriptional regulator AlpA
VEELKVRFIRPKEMSRLYGISIQVVYEAIWRGELKANKISPRTWLIEPSEADRWITRRMEQSA